MSGRLTRFASAVVPVATLAIVLVAVAGVVVAIAGVALVGVPLVVVAGSRRLERRRRSRRGRRLTDFDRRVVARFVNQTAARQRLVDGIRSSPGRYFAVVSGDPGSGKSWLVRRVALDLERDHRCVIVEAPNITQPYDLLLGLWRELERRGVGLGRTTRRWDDTRGPGWAHRSGDAEGLARSVADGFGALGVLPDAGALHQLVSGLQQMGGEADVVTRPLLPLTEALCEDLSEDVDPPLAIFFDDVRWTPAISGWLTRLCEGLPVRVSLVAAVEGQPDLYDSVLPTDIVEVGVHDLSVADACELIEKQARHRGLPIPEADVRTIVAAVGTSPWVLGLAFDAYAKTGLQDLVGESMVGVRNLVVRRGSPLPPTELQRLVVPRRLTAPLYRLVLPETDITFEAFCSWSMVKPSAGGFEIHGIVRRAFLENLQRREPDTLRDVHALCRDHFRQRADGASSAEGFGHEATRASLIEYAYHEARAAPRQVPMALGRLLRAVLLDSGDAALCLSLLDEVDEVLVDERQRAWVLAWKGEIAALRGEVSAAQRLLGEAIQLAGDIPLVPAHVTLGRLAYSQGRYEEALEHLRAAIDGADGDDDGAFHHAYAQEQLAKVLRMTGEMDAAVLAHEKAVELHERQGNTLGLSSALGSYGTTLSMRGDHAAGDRQLTRSIQVAGEHNHQHFRYTGHRSRAMARIHLCRVADAMGDAEEGLREATAFGEQLSIGMSLLYRSLARQKAGDLDAAASDLADSFVALEAVDARADLLNAAAAAIGQAVQRGELAVAVDAFEQADLGAFPAEFAYGRLWFALHGVLALRRVGRFADAAALASETSAAAAGWGMRYLQARADVELVVLARLDPSLPVEVELDAGLRSYPEVASRSGWVEAWTAWLDEPTAAGLDALESMLDGHARLGADIVDDCLSIAAQLLPTDPAAPARQLLAAHGGQIARRALDGS